MSVIERSKKRASVKQQAKGMGDVYVDQVLGTGPPAIRVRAEIDTYRATRPCPVCDQQMHRGRCEEHGKPAEDGGEWLWGIDG